MQDYHDACRNFSVAELERKFPQGSLTNGLNAAIECCDRWATMAASRSTGSARTSPGRRPSPSRRCATSPPLRQLLRARGIGRGDVVAGLLPRIPELLVVALGSLAVGAIYQPLFTAFGPAAIASRVTAAGGSQAKLIVTDEANRPKLDEVENCPPVLSRCGGDFSAALAAQSANATPVMLRGDDPFVILFTSGTTGNPKAVRWPLRMLLNIAIYMRDAIDLRPEDRFWNVADPGWAYGMAFAVIGPLLLGHATTFFEGGFTVESAVRVIASHHITNIAAAPTAYRLMMAAGDAAMAPIAGQLARREQRRRAAQPRGRCAGPSACLRVPLARSLRSDRDLDDGEQPSWPRAMP